MLEIRDLSVNYGHFTALHSLNLTVSPGEIVVMLGANGAGKSTLFRTLSGLQRPSGGTATWNGVSLTGGRPEFNVANGVAQCPGRSPAVSRTERGKEPAAGGLCSPQRPGRHGPRTGTRLRAVSGIWSKSAHVPAGSLSGGQQQMVAIARALMARPKLLLLDEPSLGLAPLVVEQVFEAVQRVNSAGVGVLLAEQNAYAALGIAHRGYVLEGGRVSLQGSQQQLMTDDRVRSAYLGV